ncbi:MAG: MFS transporter [Treponema sp.]|nr:MFS transporter [Treponema sp.]
MFTILLLIIIYISFISLGLPDSVLGSAWPSMYSALYVPLHYAGYISMIIAGGTVISSVCSARIIRCFGTGMVTAISVCMTAVALIGFSFSHSFLWLCLCAVPLGLGAGSVDAALNNYVALHYKARHMSWLHCFWGIGASLGPIIMASYLSRHYSWNTGYRTIGIMQCCLVLLLFVSLPLWEKNKSTEKPVQHAVIPFSKLFSMVGVKEVMAAFFCYCSIEMITGLWGASFLVVEKGIAPEVAARWIALYYIGITSGRFISGFVTMQLSNRQMVRLGQIIIGCGIVVLVLPFEKTLLPGLFMIGLGCAPIYPSLIHETPANFGKAYSQAIIGIQMGSAYVGTTIMPPLFGWIASCMSFNILPIFIGIILIIKVIMVEMVNRKVKQRCSTCHNADIRV